MRTSTERTIAGTCASRGVTLLSVVLMAGWAFVAHGDGYVYSGSQSVETIAPRSPFRDSNWQRPVAVSAVQPLPRQEFAAPYRFSAPPIQAPIAPIRVERPVNSTWQRPIAAPAVQPLPRQESVAPLRISTAPIGRPERPVSAGFQSPSTFWAGTPVQAPFRNSRIAAPASLHSFEVQQQLRSLNAHQAWQTRAQDAAAKVADSAVGLGASFVPGGSLAYNGTKAIIDLDPLVRGVSASKFAIGGRLEAASRSGAPMDNITVGQIATPVRGAWTWLNRFGKAGELVNNYHKFDQARTQPYTTPPKIIDVRTDDGFTRSHTVGHVSQTFTPNRCGIIGYDPSDTFKVTRQAQYTTVTTTGVRPVDIPKFERTWNINTGIGNHHTAPRVNTSFTTPKVSIPQTPRVSMPTRTRW